MEEELRTDLVRLSGELPDPWRLEHELSRFLDQPLARKWLSAGQARATTLRQFVRASRDPGLVRVAAILLFQLDPDLFYRDFVRDLGDFGRGTVEALEPGIWLGGVDEDRIVRDVVAAVDRTGNAAPLLLLQRPAARSFRDDLRRFIARRAAPLSSFAMYAFGYVAQPNDGNFLADIAEWEDVPELAALAGLYLARLGLPGAGRGLRRGLLAKDRALRERTYSSLAGIVPDDVFEAAGYQASREPETQEPAVERLLEAL